MRVKKIFFNSEKLRLRGFLDLPEVENPPLVVGCHGLHSTAESPKQIALARACNAAGIAYFRFDHRGCGESAGLFSEVTTFGGRCRDLKSAIAFLNVGDDFKFKRPIGLFGSSLGGAVCLAMAAHVKLASLVTFGTPIRSRFKAHLTDNFKGLDANKMQFDLSRQLYGIKNIFIIHGGADEIVPSEHAQEIFKQAGEPKKLMIQKAGDHRMSNPTHQHAFVSAAIRWFVKTLPPHIHA